MEEIPKQDKLDLYFITSIEKDFYKDRNIEFTYQSKMIKEFNYSEIYSEDKEIKEKIYTNKLNLISITLSEKGILKNNVVLLKIKNGSKFYFYDCTLERDSKIINSEKKIYFLYNFKIGEYKKNNNSLSDKIISDAMINIQISLIEIQENKIPQNDMTFFEKFEFLRRGVGYVEEQKKIFGYFMEDTFDEIENIYIKDRSKIKFIELLILIKIILEKEENKDENIIDKFIDLFTKLLNNKLIFYDKIENEIIAEYLSLFNSIKENELLYQKLHILISLFRGYYDEIPNILQYLNDKKNSKILSELYKNNLYEPSNGQIKEKIIDILMNDYCQSFEDFLSIINKNNCITDKLKIIIKYFEIFKKILNEDNIKSLPINFSDNIKSEEKPHLFAELHKKIVEMELNLGSELKKKNIFSFYDVIKNYIKLYESGLGTKEKMDDFFQIKNIIKEEYKINKESMENLYNYMNKLIHENIIELVKKNILKNIDLLKILKEDEYFLDDLYRINNDDFLILNNFNLKEIFAEKESDDNEFFIIYNEYQIWNPFIKTKENIKSYLQIFTTELDNIKFLNVFYKILPLEKYNYTATEELISWLEKNMKTFSKNIIIDVDSKNKFLKGINNLLFLCVKVHYDVEKFLTFLENFFMNNIKHIKDLDINNGIELLNELYIYFINQYNTENNKNVPINVQNKILDFYIKNSDLKLNIEFLFISFLNKIIIDELHLNFEILMNDLENFEINKNDLLTENNIDNNIKFKIFEFLINKYKIEFDNKNNDSNYMIKTRKSIKYFIIKEIEEKNISYNDINIMFNNGINLELIEKNIINKLILCSKIKKTEAQKDIYKYYESLYNELKNNFLKCKNLMTQLENSIQYFLFFDSDNETETEEIKQLLNEFKSKKIKDFFNEENTTKLNKFNTLIKFADKACLLKNSHCFMSIYEDLLKKMRDPNIKENYGKIDKQDVYINIKSSIENFNKLKNMIEEFNKHKSDIETFSHYGVKYFYEIGIKKGENALKKEIDFVINYFINNIENNDDIEICKNFDKNKFVEYIKKITKREKILIKCKSMKHIINIFLNPQIYIHSNKEKKKIEKRIIEEEIKKQQEKIELTKTWNFLDFDSIFSIFGKKKINEEPPPRITVAENKDESLQNPPDNNNIIKNNSSQIINGILNNSEFMKSLNSFIQNLEDKNISLKKLNEIIDNISTLNLEINLNIKDNENNDKIDDTDILLEEFFMKFIDKPETLYYTRMKKFDEVKNIFKNGCIEIENTILKDEDINDFISCVKIINNLAENFEKMISNGKNKDLPKEIIIQFFTKIKNNEDNFLKSILNYLSKFNQIKLTLNEIIATPEISIKKIRGILSNSNFIIKYDEANFRYILSGKFYKLDKYNNEIITDIKYQEMENLRQRILTMDMKSEIYQEAIIFQKIFNDMKKVLEILKDMDKTCYPDKFVILFNIKNQKLYCNYNNQQAFNNIKDLTNVLIKQKEIQEQYLEKYYEDNKVLRLIYGKQINLLYNFIRYKENKDAVDDLFRLITNGRINSSYPPEYKSYSENIFQDMIKNVNNYILLVFQSNGINSWYDALNSNKININVKDNQGNKYQGIYLFVSTEDNYEKEILNIYRKNANLPLYTTLLICNNFTTEEEIKAFLYRSILCEREILFMLANVNHLEPKKRNMLLNIIKYLIDKIISEHRTMVSTLIISSTDSNSEIFRSLKNYNPLDFRIKSLEYNEDDYKYLHKINMDKIRLVQSDSSGVGKSRYIRNVDGAYESNLIYFPLGGNLNRKIIYNRLYDSIHKINEKNLTMIFLHIDLSQTNHHEILKEFLFEIIIFRKYSMSSKNSDKIIYLNNKYRIFIEIPYESSVKKDLKNANNYFQKYSIFSLFSENNITNLLLNNLSEFYEEMSEQEKKNLIMNPDFVYIKTLSDSKLQLVSKTLDAHSKGTIFYEVIEPNSTDNMDVKICNQLLNKYILGANIPNFYQKNIFINLLYDKFLGFHHNTNLNPQNLIKNAKKLKIPNSQNIQDMRPLIITNLITHAFNFSKGFAENIAKSQERTNEIIQIQDYNKRKELAEELKKREDYLKFRYEFIKPSIIFIDKKGENITIIPTCAKNSEEDKFLTNLNYLIKIKPNGKLSELSMNLKYPIKMNSQELMDELLDLIGGRRLSLDIVNKILSEYALTPDNFIKMILILDRINCDIPVILMGETGCGKTSLIKILANIIFKGNLKDNLKILNIHSGIEDNEIIKFMENIISEAQMSENSKITSMIDEYNLLTPEQKQNYLNIKKTTEKNLIENYKKKLDEEKIWVFFDEINSCNSMGLLTEILCKKTYLGNKIPKKFIFLAACNPYRAMGELNKIDHALIHKGQEKRKLVYTVYPLPHNMLNFVLDFGNLTYDEEKQYIQIMVRKMMEKIMIDKEKGDSNKIINIAIVSILECQSYIKNTNDVSSVSLREVKRFVVFFKYFVIYLLNKKNNTKYKDQSIVFYSLKTNFEIYKYAVILSLYICYYLRLPDNKSRSELLSILEKKKLFNENFLLVPELEMDYVAENILNSKENESLSKGIAKNRALLENLFSLYFCTVNKIPLIICGKPGSTKTLSQKLLQNALKGMVSSTPLCKETKELVVFPYQGSLSSTADEIKQVFQKAKNYQKSNKDTIAMVCIEEIGLAEINKNSPLKVIHSELEMNFDFEVNDDFEENLFNSYNNDKAKIAFLGISNWSLDASKMNRVIFNVIQKPDIADLKKTAMEIASSINEKIANKYIVFYEQIAESYFNYIEQKRRDDRADVNFHGLRDFYNIIKSITRELNDIDLKQNKLELIENKKNLDEIVMRNIERNFGGLPLSVYDFKNEYFKINKEKKENLDKNYNVLRCIKENLFDKESRYLLLITKNNFDIELINFLIEEILQLNDNNKTTNFETKYILGSSFSQDNNEIYKEKIIGIIRNEMNTNNLLILKNLELIYSSLYDLLNQDFEKIDNKYYTNISFGLWKPFSLINKNFKIIVILNEKNLCYEDPPFLNRFEKHIFNLDNLLNKEEKNLAKEIYDLIIKMINFENSKFDMNKFLVNFSLEEIEVLVYKYSKLNDKNKNINIFNEVLSIIVPMFPEEIIASIFVSGFKEEKKDISDKIIEIYKEKHAHNFNDFINNKMIMKKNIIYTYSSITDKLIFENNNILLDDKDDINDMENRIIMENEDIKETFSKEKTKEIYIESIKSIIELEKMIEDYMNEENENLFVIKFRNKQKELEKMYQVNILIDGFITKYNSKNKNKYFVFIVYLIKDDISKLNLSEHLISKVSKNTYSIFIDNLNGREYNLIKLLTMKNDELFKFFLIDELHKNIDISFRFMAYEFSNNETDDLNRNNYRKIMLEKIINNKNIQKYIGICLLKLSINPKEILKPIFIKENVNDNKNKKNKQKEKNKLIFDIEEDKSDIDFIETFKKVIFQNVEFYLIKIIYCLEKSQILHPICFNPEMLNKKIITEKIIQNYITNELEEQLSMNKISTNFNMKNKLSIILNIKIPLISKGIIIGKIFKYIKDEIILKYQANELKLIDVITDNSIIEETINEYNDTLNQLNENIYIALMNQEILKEIIYSDDTYLINSLLHDFILLFILDGKRFNDGEYFEELYRFIDILIQLRVLNIQENNFSFVNKNKSITLLKLYDILYNDNIKSNNKNKIGITLAKILGFLFGYQNEINTLLEIYVFLRKHIPNLLQNLEDIISKKEIKNEISERNPDYCRIVKESFFIIYESLLRCISKQYDLNYNDEELNEEKEKNEIRDEYDSDLENESDSNNEENLDDFTLFKNDEAVNNDNNIALEENKNNLNQFGVIPMACIENISKLSIDLEKKMLLYSKELFVIKNLTEIFKVLNAPKNNKVLINENTNTIINIICTSHKLIEKKNFKILFNKFLLLMEILGKILGKETTQFADIIIMLVINQFLIIKDISYKVKILNILYPLQDKKAKNKITYNPILIERSLPLLILLFNKGSENYNKPDLLIPNYNDKLSSEEKKEKFLFFVKNEKSEQYKLLKIINRQNIVLDQIILYYFEYLCELYFNEIKNQKKENIYVNILGDTSLDYLNEALLYLDDEVFGNNKIGNKSNYLNKIGKLYCLAYVKKYINNYIEINKNHFNELYLWEDINCVLYSKNNKMRRMIKYYILKRYFNTFDNEKDFINFNFELKKIPISTKYQEFKLEIVKHQYDYNLIPYLHKKEYLEYSQSLSMGNFNKNKFINFISDTNNTNMIDFFFDFYVNNFLLQNFQNEFYMEKNNDIYKFMIDEIERLELIPQEAKKIFRLLLPNEFFSKVKPYIGNKISLKQYEIFIYCLRFCLISLGNKRKNFYTDLLSINCFQTLSNNFLPGKPATFDQFKESYEMIKENLTKDPLKFGAYICSCGYYYSVGECTFPTVISTCPICGEKIGGEHHILYKRVGHMRIFLNAETRKTKFDLSYADKNMNNMLLDEFYTNIVSTHVTKEIRYCDLKRKMGCSKENFLRREKIRNLEQFSYRLLSFIYYSHIFISRVMGYINDENLINFGVKDLTLFEVLEADWDIMQDLCQKNIHIILNILYGSIYQIFYSVDYFYSIGPFEYFENLFNQRIKSELNNNKEISEYENLNKRLLDFDPFSDMTIIAERFPPSIYKPEIYPCFEFLLISKLPGIDMFKKKFLNIENTEDKYPLLRIILTQDMDKIRLLQEIPKINKLSNYLIEKCSFKYSRKSANDLRLKSEFDFSEIKQDVLDFINSWYKIRPLVENYGCKHFKNNNQKYFVDISTNSPLAYFLVDEGDFGHGMVLAAMYKTLQDIQNTFLNQIINSKSEILSCFNEQLNREIMIQDVNKNEIINLDKINNDVIKDIIIKNSLPDIFGNIITEKEINYNNLCTFEHNFAKIELELGSILLPGLRKFKDDIRFVTYKYEGFRGNKSSIITNFNEKYPQKELNEKQIKYIEDFINKGDKKKNKLEKKIFDKKDIKNMLFSLQLLIDYFQRENFDKYESICDLIKKLPKEINICDEIRLFFKSNGKEKEKEKIKKDNENSFNILNNDDEEEEINLNTNKNNNNNDICASFALNTLISIFELFEKLCWDSFKENLVGDYMQNIDSVWAKQIDTYFNQLQYYNDRIIKRENFCTALRRFISRYLAGKRGENEINENNTLLNELIRPELWEPYFTESETFEIEIGKLMEVMTDEFAGGLKVGQGLFLYNYLTCKK